MIKKILSFFEAASKQDENDSTSTDILLASLALLVEVAKSDHDLDPLEQQQIIEVAVKEFGIGHDEQKALVTQAKEVASNATSLYEYTSVINENYSDEKKYQLILSMWRVAFADGRIDRYEEHLIRRVADLIYVPHLKFIEAKHSAEALGKS